MTNHMEIFFRFYYLVNKDSLIIFSGTGSVNVCNRNLSSEKGWTEVEFGIGNGPLLGFKIFRTLSRLMFLNCGTVLQFTPRGISPSLISSKSNFVARSAIVKFIIWDFVELHCFDTLWWLPLLILAFKSCIVLVIAPQD